MNRLAHALAAVALIFAAACTTAGKHAEKPPVPPMETAPPPPQVDAAMDDVKKAVAEQLECPIEQVNIVCVRRDTQGDCIAVRGDGCGKTLEYQFGDV